MTLFSLARFGANGDADAVMDDDRPAVATGAESAERTADVEPAGLASFFFEGWYLLSTTVMSPVGVDTVAVVGGGACDASTAGSSTMVLAISSSVGNGRSSLSVGAVAASASVSPFLSVSPFSVPVSYTHLTLPTILLV